MKAELKWQGKMTFEARNRGLTSTMDVPPEQGGDNHGPTPKEQLLNAMCACTGMDVVSIAEKMRLQITSLNIEASATKTPTIPSYFGEVHMKYVVEGAEEPEKVIRAVALSMTKYCGVSYMVSKVTPITYEIFLNHKLIHQDRANFSLEVIHDS